MDIVTTRSRINIKQAKRELLRRQKELVENNEIIRDFMLDYKAKKEQLNRFEEMYKIIE